MRKLFYTGAIACLMGGSLVLGTAIAKGPAPKAPELKLLKDAAFTPIMKEGPLPAVSPIEGDGSKGPYMGYLKLPAGFVSPPHSHRRHSTEFKQKVCTEIRSGVVGRREAQRLYRLSDNLIHAWLIQFDAAVQASVTPVASATAPAVHRETFEQKIAALERKVGQLTMALDEHRPSRRQRR